MGPPLGEVGFVIQLFYASFEAGVSPSTCRGHPPCPPFDTCIELQFKNKKEIHTCFANSLRPCFRARGPLGRFCRLSAYPAQIHAELAAQLARKLVNDLAAQCSDAMPGGKRSREGPGPSLWSFPPRAGVFCAGCPSSLRPSDGPSFCNTCGAGSFPRSDRTE